ncbi:hypothetical protein [Sphingobacterium sp. DR205]|uniref:hypothetical protein n=1 Tax=Sphingobacterium sp. DR205 TaxID=2713573 RepID=UPI0013E4D7D6|nr:hypothetical protein [Sphingobacterium sp. DR205]QIH33818.1 hypothetical protein G6053_13410 [Sphingobacterium sp. DR205]
MECPQGLMFNPQITACDFPFEITDDWVSPFFWYILYNDGSDEYLPYANELEEVVVYPPDNGPPNTVGGGGGLPVRPGR